MLFSAQETKSNMNINKKYLLKIDDTSHLNRIRNFNYRITKYYHFYFFYKYLKGAHEF